jgi:hypothetical protein
MKIAIFPENGSLNSRPVFNAFIEHLRSKGEKISINKDEDCDVAVIWSVLWSGRMSSNRNLWNSFQERNKPVVVMEVGGLKRNSTWKIGINGINRDADFANDEFDDKRWPKFNIEMKPWKQTGNTIIICGQHDASHQWREKPSMNDWVEQQIIEIRKYSNFPILVRPHPRNVFDLNEKKYSNVRLGKPQRDTSTYDDTDFKKTLKSAWAVINYSSNPAIESVINGIPVFVSESSLCYDVGNHSLSKIENPTMPERRQWANKLAYTEWTVSEIREGLPWARIRQRLEEKYIR